jgi:hypothetical protein
VNGFTALLEATRTAFSAPSFAIFVELISGWVIAPGRRTITSIIAVADPAWRRAHDAYHRFVRDGAWEMGRLWQVIVVGAVDRLCPDGVISLDCDDTLWRKAGRCIDGAGRWRDPLRSYAHQIVYATGLHLVVVTMRITPRWAGCPIGIPINVRLHRKNDPTATTAHAAEMIREIAGWLPERCFQ